MSTEILTGPKQFGRRAWAIFFIFGLLLLAYGFYAFSLPDRDPQIWDFLGKDKEVFDYLNETFRLIGMLSVGFAIFTMAVSMTAYRRGERWAWYAFWYWPIFWLLAAVYTWPDASFLLLFLIASLAGLMLPYRKFFPKRPPT